MVFFEGLATVEQIKLEYKRLARLHHPDLGGDLETMKQLNNEYEAVLKGCDGQRSSGSDGRSHVYRYDPTVESEIIEFIYNFLSLQLDLRADLIGRWVWIRGNTKPHRNELKALGCRWHPDRGCWYYRPPSAGYGRGRGASLEELAAKYGCVNVEEFKDKDKEPKQKQKQKRRKLTAV